MKKEHLKFSNRKISETFLEFSSPLLDAIGEAATKDQVEKVLQITYSVWNSIVLDTVRGSEKNISMLRETIKGDQMASSMIEQLISRKMELYADDLRLIGEFSITQKKGGVASSRRCTRSICDSVKFSAAMPNQPVEQTACR